MQIHLVFCNLRKSFMIYFLLVCTNLNAQNPSWEWAKSIGGKYFDESSDIKTDSKGNTYITGGFGYFYDSFLKSEIYFDSILLKSEGGSDIFIVKIDQLGKVIWAKSYGGNNDEYGMEITIDQDGNVYVAGFFQSSSLKFGNTVLKNSGNPDVFLVKYDKDGNVIWAKSGGGKGWDWVRGLSIDSHGNAYLIGHYRDTISFDSSYLYGKGLDDIFIVKYDSNGLVKWARSEGGKDHDDGFDVLVETNGNYYIIGQYRDSIKFGSTTLICNGVYDIFVTKYDSNGNVKWVKSSGGDQFEGVSNIINDTEGNLYVTGGFISSSISFGSTKLLNHNAGKSDIFIVKYDTSGKVLWATSEGADDSEGGEISIDPLGNMYLVGSFTSSPLTFGKHSLICEGRTDIFIVKYDSKGSVIWAKSIGGLDKENCSGFSMDEKANIFIIGNFNSSSLTIGKSKLTDSGNGDFLITKLNTGSINKIGDNENEVKGVVYPNPFQTFFSINTEIYTNNATLVFYNTFGIIEKKIENIHGNLINVDIEKLPKGIYILQLIENNKILFNKKVLINN
jgi:hypothetical protein